MSRVANTIESKWNRDVNKVQSSPSSMKPDSINNSNPKQADDH